MNNVNNKWADGLQRGVSGLLTGVLRAGLAVLALGITLVLMVFGLLFAAGLVGWALLRGRRPTQVNWRRGWSVPPGMAAGRWGRGPGPAGGAASNGANRQSQRQRLGEVVDIEAREVPPPASPR